MNATKTCTTRLSPNQWTYNNEHTWPQVSITDYKVINWNNECN
jgi:hypothetical protein